MAETGGRRSVSGSLQQAGQNLADGQCRLRPIGTIADDVGASSAMDNVQQHPTTQSVKESLTQGPVAESLKDQSAKTTSDLSNLKDSRKMPEVSAATGQPLTHYHSFFYNLLSWEHPRATAISYVIVVAAIFAARYLAALPYVLKMLYLTLGATAVAELAGKMVMSHGLMSSFRPKKYYTIPRESLEASLDDIEHLINFFVIEFQRVLFAENVPATAIACLTALISYWLIKIVPFWGLSLIGVTCVYFVPLIYSTNKEFIDENLAHAQNIISSQAAQVKDLAGQHTSHASGVMKQYTNEYTSKAQEMIGSARAASPPSNMSKKEASASGPGVPPTTTATTESVPLANDFPHAPKQDPVTATISHEEQYAQSEFGGKVPAS